MGSILLYSKIMKIEKKGKKVFLDVKMKWIDSNNFSEMKMENK